VSTATDIQTTPSLPPWIDAATIDALAAAVASRVAELIPESEPERVWLNMADAAAYMGTTRDALRKLTSARTIEFSQAAPGGPCWFRREWLDDHRERHRKSGRIDY
jgi:hypothetical protein